MEVTGFFTAIILGLIIGALGRLAFPDTPLWLTLVTGVVAALIGTLLAAAIGFDDTPGIDRIELALQAATAAGGVMQVTGTQSRRKV